MIEKNRSKLANIVSIILFNSIVVYGLMSVFNGILIVQWEDNNIIWYIICCIGYSLIDILIYLKTIK